jgi:hypothetical protein
LPFLMDKGSVNPEKPDDFSVVFNFNLSCVN